ncbi:MAG: T9SS type A sorting domain-containing protein [Bacteroidota bacterium]
MRLLATILLTFACGLAPALAQHAKTVPSAVSAIALDDGIDSPTDAFRSVADVSTDFEASEGFAPGYCAQNGWTAFAASTTQGTVNAANPYSGSQHLRIADDPTQADGTSTGCFSPDEGAQPAGTYAVQFKIAISATLGADYDIIAQSPAQAALTARMKFNFEGNIFVIDDPGTGLAFVDTGVAWSVGPYVEGRIVVDGVTGIQQYFYNDVLIYTTNPLPTLATSIDQVIFLSDNFHIGDVGDLDDLYYGLLANIPVELTSFNAVMDGESVVLDWQTASETINAGFEVQMRDGNSGEFQTLDFVEGAGTTTEAQTYSFRVADLRAGTYTFRLKQVDFDGAFEYSPEVEASVAVLQTHDLSEVYPNPFARRATLDLAVREAQDVRVEVFNLMGQRVATLLDGAMEANVSTEVALDASDLPGGLYLVRVTGETFQTTRKVTVTK